MDVNLNNDLITRFREGHSTALTLILNRYQREIRYFANSILKNRETAEEIVDDCFLKTWNVRTQFESLPALKSYLYTVTRNACLDHLRSPRSRRWESVDEQVQAIASPENIEARMIHAELLGSIYEEVSKLPNKQRQVFELSYFEGLSVQEIAAHLEISPNAVSIHKHEATKAIRRLFQERDPLLLAIFLYYFVPVVN